MLYLLRLRKILLLNYLYIILVTICLLYAFLNNYFIKHVSLYNFETEFSGTVKEYSFDGNKLTIIFKDKELIRATYYLKTIDEKNYYLDNLKYGIKINIEGDLSDPINNTIPNTFNYKKYLSHKHIYKLLKVDKLKIVSKEISIGYKIKNYFNDRINTLIDGDYIKTFILGNKTGIDDEEFSNYQILGVTHLFAISGMHIGLFAGVLLGLLKRLKVNDDKALIISAIIIGLYGLLTGFPASVRRAYILYLLVVINKIYFFNIKPINLLILTVSFNILIDYNIIFDIGFLYSVATTGGLMLCHEYLNTGNYFVKLFKVSLIAFLFSMPITINNFYYINPLTPLNNLFIVPLVSLLIYPFSLIVFIFPFTGFMFNWAISLLKITETLLIKINIFKIVIPKLSIAFIVIYYILLLIILLKHKKVFIVVLILLFGIIIIKPYTDKKGYVYFLDVGQGDSALIISPYRKDIILIDTGGTLPSSEKEWEKKKKTFQVSDNTITFMHSLGIFKIDELIITHGDADHGGEALNIIKNMDVLKLTLNNGDKNELEESLPIINGVSNYKNVMVKRLNFKDYNDENANSQIDFVKIYKTSFLFMGDAGKAQELDLIKKYNLNVQVLKLGHHGSKTSSDKAFLKTIMPSMSIISSGRNNRFNHPSIDTITSLNDLNLSYLNTQTSGTIQFIINEVNYSIKEYKP